MQNILSSRKVRVLLLLGLCIFTFVKVRTQQPWKSKHLTEEERTRDLEQMPQWDSKGKVLGNPQNAIDDLQKLYLCMQTFHKIFKRYPESEIELINHMGTHLPLYGLANQAEVRAITSNPDMIYSWVPYFRQNPKTVIAYTFRNKRFDGQPVGSPRPQGQRDVLASTNLYYFPNTKMDWKNIKASTMNPVGFYVVLWDDGQVEKVPFDKVLQVPKGNNEWTTGFPGQAGLPEGTKTFDEFNRDGINYQNWKRAQAQPAKAASTSP